MTDWAGPAQKTVVSPEFVCSATIRRSNPLGLRGSESTPELTIWTAHIPEMAHRDMALLQRNGSVFQQRTLMSGEAVDLKCRLLGYCVDGRINAKQGSSACPNLTLTAGTAPRPHLSI